VDKHGSIFVADFDNNRVELLSHTLAHIGYITSPPGYVFDLPFPIHLDELNNLLYIGEFGSGRVFVFAVDISEGTNKTSAIDAGMFLLHYIIISCL